MRKSKPPPPLRFLDQRLGIVGGGEHVCVVALVGLVPAQPFPGKLGRYELLDIVIFVR
jgi:hypothetical protein